MVNIVEILNNTLFQLAIVIVIFLVLTLLVGFIYKKLKAKFGKSIDINSLLPVDEVHSLRQIFYLIMMALCIVNVFYSLTSFEMNLIHFVIFDLALSLYFAITLDMGSTKNKVLWLLLVPYGALFYSLFNVNVLAFILDLIHVLIFIYFAKLNFDRFMEYTNSNSLGLSIVLLFVIIFVSFFITQYAEDVNALDSLVMVSNEFTGNGFAVFGNSIAGKLNSLLLVWGGYVISGVGAATLTATILTKHFNKRFRELERLIEGDDE